MIVVDRVRVYCLPIGLGVVGREGGVRCKLCGDLVYVDESWIRRSFQLEWNASEAQFVF